MQKLIKKKVTTGIYWVEAPQANLRILCGCPADSVKHLRKLGLIIPTEKNGVTFETGPNVILLSEILIQKEQFSNLSEFPVLQMLYFQGLILPNHPNNTGIKPLLIGSKEQVAAQKEYIYRGNYGLISIEELQKAGLNNEEAQEQMKMKLRFAFGTIRMTDELLDSLVVQEDYSEIRNKLFIRRIGINQFEFKYEDETVTIDLNLAQNETYSPPYRLGFHQTQKEYFSIIHSGEGDGWDQDRPCMASIIVYKGKIYLIDAGPNISDSLMALGIDPSEIEGVFHTHAHDDHFAGLPTLLSSDHRIKYFTTSLVRASVTKKLCALMSIREEKFSQYFEIHDLEFDTWKNIDGLEVKPIFSPHPVETNTFVFRTFGENGYRTYAHWADIASRDILKGMVTKDNSQNGISKKLFEKVKNEYATSVNLKKIDIGGGMIHGNAEDFKKDKSDKIILAHTSLPLTSQQKAIGSNASFGMTDVLIPANRNFLRKRAEKYLKEYFPDIHSEEIESLINCEIVPFNAGSVIFKEGERVKNAYLILSGTVEYIEVKKDIQRMLSTGGFIGGFLILDDGVSPGTYRAASCLQALRIPMNLGRHFIENNGLNDYMQRMEEFRNFLHSTWLFGDGLSYPVQEKIARMMKETVYSTGDNIVFEGQDKCGLFLLNEGKVEMSLHGDVLETLGRGEVFAEESFLYETLNCFDVKAIESSKIYNITDLSILQIPIVNLRLLSITSKRKRTLVSHLLSGIS